MRMLLELEAGRLLQAEHRAALEALAKCDEIRAAQGAVIEALDWETKLSEQQLEKERDLCKRQVEAAGPGWAEQIVKALGILGIGILIGLAL